jgi:small subunit ribosomal protein S4
VSKIIQSKYKASRRLGVSIWGSAKDAFNKRKYRPGQHGLNPTAGKTSDYGTHLHAKQRIKAHYGRINERQFSNIFELAAKMKGNTGENFIGLLERRLDAVVYRLNFAATIFGSRQLVSHGHIRVNGKKVNIPSYRVAEGDVIELKESSKQIPVIVESITKMERRIPDYITFDSSSFKGTFARIPSVSDVPYPFEAEVHMVVELYSR